jgi:hypothetical protein
MGKVIKDVLLEAREKSAPHNKKTEIEGENKQS